MTEQSDDALVEELAKTLRPFLSRRAPAASAARAILPILHARIEAERDHGKFLAATAYESGRAAGLAEGRKQALEEAAKVALEVDWGGKTYDAIRALGDKP